MNIQLVLLLALAAVAASDSQPSSFYGVPQARAQVSDDSSETSSESRHIYRSHDRSDEDSAEYGPAKYDFDWAVNHDYSGNHFGHQESRDGAYTQGSYYVQLPDTRLQTVKYYVDGDSGYVAEVEYEGEAQHPESEEYRVSRGRYSAQDSGEDSSESLVLLLALAAVAASDSQPSSFYGVPQARAQVSDDSSETSSESRHIYRSHDRSDEDSAEYGPAKYDFDWAVNHDYSGNHFGHQESRDGDYTQGSYYVQLPDTRLQTVKYYVDGDSGYVAEGGVRGRGSAS
ncbi:uncharacterized protein LOC134777258 [Penaeus indicus]|uniref:uncharacterized protein LOC134777258 n=1 Tax=Penaeus indicus TaxID=29960 RepID=UPI00300C1A66